MRKGEFKWSVSAKNGFALLKKKVTKRHVLKSTPISFFSKKLNEGKHKYLLYDQEFYAIV